jgi:hypothetical protein
LNIVTFAPRGSKCLIIPVLIKPVPPMSSTFITTLFPDLGAIRKLLEPQVDADKCGLQSEFATESAEDTENGS